MLMLVSINVSPNFGHHQGVSRCRTAISDEMCNPRLVFKLKIYINEQSRVKSK